MTESLSWQPWHFLFDSTGNSPFPWYENLTNKLFVFAFLPGQLLSRSESSPVPSCGSEFAYMIPPENITPDWVIPARVHPGFSTAERTSSRYRKLRWVKEGREKLKVHHVIYGWWQIWTDSSILWDSIAVRVKKVGLYLEPISLKMKRWKAV